MQWVLIILFLRVIQAYDPCSPNPCQNGGTCEDLGCNYDEIITSTYTSFGSGMCSDLVALPEGEYPPLLSNTSELYNVDRNQECMQRCLDTCTDYVMFTVRNSDNRCACSPLCEFFAGDLINPNDYETYEIDEPDVTEFFCECSVGFGGQTCSDPVPGCGDDSGPSFGSFYTMRQAQMILELAQYTGVPAVFNQRHSGVLQTTDYPTEYAP